MAAQAERLRSTYVPQSETALIKFLENLHLSALSYKQTWTKDWERNAQVYRGNNWDSKKEGNPFFKTNLARAKLDKKAAKMIACKPVFSVLPRRSGLSEAAKVLQRTIDAGWDAWSIQMRLEQLSAFVRPFGCGYFKTVWDPRARQGLGDIVVAEIDPRAITIDPYTLRAYDLDRSVLVIHDTSVPLSWVEENYPDKVDDIQDFTAPPPTQPDKGYDNASKLAAGPIRTPLRYYMGGMRSTGEPGSITPIPYVRIREFWFADPQTENDEPLYPNGRVLYLIGTGTKATVLNPEPEDSRNPFFDGMWPYDMFDNRGDVDHPYGSSEVEDVKRLEEAINRAGHMGMRYLIKNIPFIISDAGALTPEVLKRLQDFGDVVINKMRGLDVARIPANNPLGEIINWIKVNDQLMDSAIGLGGSSPTGGHGRVELRSPDLLYGLQSSQDDVVNQQARRLESFLERVGQKMISRIFQFYRTDRFIPYVAGDNYASFQFEVNKLRGEIYAMALSSVTQRLIAEQQDEDEERTKARKDYNGRQVRLAVGEALRGAWREFDFKIVPLSSLATTRAARVKAMQGFAEMGMMPFSKLLEEAGFSNADDLFDQAAKEHQKLMAMGLLPPPDEKKGKKKK